MKNSSRNSVRAAALKQGYRSGLEEKIASQLEEAGVVSKYESVKIHYKWPEKDSSYRPDFPLPNGIIIESKGRFVTRDRQKHLIIKQQHPHLDIRFVFSRSASPIGKGSNTSYAMWCDKNGFKYADKLIPESWLTEKQT
jgi:hypothetical protein